MKKIILAFLHFVIMLSAANAQNSINFYHSYPAGGRLAMFVDSGARNVYYENIFHYLSKDADYILCILTLFGKNLVKLDIV